MKKLTAIFPDNVDINLGLIAKVATEVKIETLTNGKLPVTRHHGLEPVDGVIMKHFTPSGSFRSSMAEEWIMKEGYQAKSAYGALSDLVKLGKIERLHKGAYRFVKQ